MTTHYIAVTIDTDPDGLNTNTPDRRNLVWDGLHFAMENFHDTLPYPLTWYVRADGQLEYAYGSARYMLDTYADFWQKAVAHGDELGWHPHLYTVPEDTQAQPEIITNSDQAVAELRRIWEQIKNTPFDLPSFRMGEAWHTPDTLNLIEELGFSVDSTAIPDRDDSASGHPRNWKDAPNHPYYPDKMIPRLQGDKRHLIEIPMNSWYFQASYDKAPKLRYMNPCIHTDLWQQALTRWHDNLPDQSAYYWVLILHPAEAMPQDESDLLYAYSLDAMNQNIDTLKNTILKMGHHIEMTTIADIAQKARHSLSHDTT